MSIVDSIAVFISAIISSMGLGGGGILILYLTIFQDSPQLPAQGTNLLFFMPCAVVSLIIYSKMKLIRFKEISLPVLGGFIGVALGYFALLLIDSKYIGKIFAVFLILSGAASLLKTIKNKN